MTENTAKNPYSIYKKEGPYTLEDGMDVKKNDFDGMIEPVIEPVSEYEPLKSKPRRNTQNERLRMKNQELENRLALLESDARRRELELHERALAEKSTHYGLAFEGAAENSNFSAMSSTVKDLAQTEAKRAIYETLKAAPLQAAAPSYGSYAVPETENFYTPQQRSNIDKLLDKFNFIDPRGDNPNYSPTHFAQADEIQKQLLQEYKEAGRGDEEFSPEFTRTLEERLKQRFNKNSSNNQSSRMVAPVNHQRNLMGDSNAGLSERDVKLIKSFGNHFGADFVNIARDSLKDFKMNPEKCHEETLLNEMIKF